MKKLNPDRLAAILKREDGLLGVMCATPPTKAEPYLVIEIGTDSDPYNGMTDEEVKSKLTEEIQRLDGRLEGE